MLSTLWTVGWLIGFINCQIKINQLLKKRFFIEIFFKIENYRFLLLFLSLLFTESKPV